MRRAAHACLLLAPSRRIAVISNGRYHRWGSFSAARALTSKPCGELGAGGSGRIGRGIPCHPGQGHRSSTRLSATAHGARQAAIPALRLDAFEQRNGQGANRPRNNPDQITMLRPWAASVR